MSLYSIGVGEEGSSLDVIKRELGALKTYASQFGTRAKFKRNGRDVDITRHVHDAGDEFDMEALEISEEPNPFVMTSTRINALNSALVSEIGKIRTSDPSIVVSRILVTQPIDTLIKQLENLVETSEGLAIKPEPKVKRAGLGGLGLILLGLVAALAGVLAKGVR